MKHYQFAVISSLLGLLALGSGALAADEAALTESDVVADLDAETLPNDGFAYVYEQLRAGLRRTFTLTVEKKAVFDRELLHRLDSKLIACAALDDEECLQKVTSDIERARARHEKLLAQQKQPDGDYLEDFRQWREQSKVSIEALHNYARATVAASQLDQAQELMRQAREAASQGRQAEARQLLEQARQAALVAQQERAAQIRQAEQTRAAERQAIQTQRAAGQQVQEAETTQQVVQRQYEQALNVVRTGQPRSTQEAQQQLNQLRDAQIRRLDVFRKQVLPPQTPAQQRYTEAVNRLTANSSTTGQQGQQLLDQLRIAQREVVAEIAPSQSPAAQRYTNTVTNLLNDPNPASAKQGQQQLDQLREAERQKLQEALQAIQQKKQSGPMQSTAPSALVISSPKTAERNVVSGDLTGAQPTLNAPALGGTELTTNPALLPAHLAPAAKPGVEQVFTAPVKVEENQGQFKEAPDYKCRISDGCTNAQLNDMKASQKQLSEKIATGGEVSSDELLEVERVKQGEGWRKINTARGALEWGREQLKTAKEYACKISYFNCTNAQKQAR